MRQLIANSELVEDWNWTLNDQLKLNPFDLTTKSNKKVWWNCERGHEYDARPCDRTKGQKCPYCAGKRVLVGFNDLLTINPFIAAQWNYEKNGELLPTQVTAGSNKKVWWLCPICSYEWCANIKNRTYLNRGCPRCAREKQTSSPEQKIYYYIKKYFSDTINRYDDQEHGITELDIYIPSLSIGIEYDGGLWHQDIEKDKIKDLKCKNNAITLIRIRDPKCPVYESSCFFIYLEDRSSQSLANTIAYILYLLNIDDPNVDFNKDLPEIESLIYRQVKENSLTQLYPDIALEWHPTKNGSLKPEYVLAHSGKRVWWQCKKCGHEWITDICSRTSGTGCPECKKEKIRKAQSEPVYCPQLGQQFSSMHEAELKSGVPQGSISNCCLGKANFAGKHPVTGEKLTWIKI